MSERELDDLVARLRSGPYQTHDELDAVSAIAALRQERDHFRDCMSAREVRRIVDERDAARAEADALRALLLDAKRFTPLPTSQRIDAALHRERCP